MRIVLENIKELVQVTDCSLKYKAGADMSKLNVIRDAYLVMRDGIIEGYGLMDHLNDEKLDNDVLMELDCTGRLVFPTYCDPHTHLVFSASRESEFVDRIKGLTYPEIAAKGGGILNSTKNMQACSEDELFDASMKRLHDIATMGTGAVEIKSGYGLTTESELKMLRVIRRLKENSPLIIKSTFLGAHAIPEIFSNDRQKYIELIVHEMIPQIAADELADYIDVFCDTGFFTPLETEQILMAGIKYGLRPKIHANELGFSDGVQVGVKYHALSVDHLEYVGATEIQTLKSSETMPVVLPGAAFFLNMPLSPVREMIASGLPIALASDFNPGSSPSGNMNLMQSFGCINYKMTPEEVINAATINAAYAMGVEGICGSICQGKLGNLFITRELPGYAAMPYYFGMNLIETVILDGEFI